MATGKQLEDLFEALKERKIIKNKAEFCSLMNIDYKSFSRLLRGELNYPINPVNYDILKKLDINLEWFIVGQGPMFLDEKKTSSQEGKESSKADAEELKKKEAEIEKLKTELEELKKIVAGLEKDNKELSSELLEKYRELTGFLKPKSDRFEFT